MAVQIDGQAPYAPVSAIVAVIERHRQVGLSMVTLDVLVRMGITDSLAPRVHQALRLLDLINDDGSTSQNFEVLRRAPTPDVPARLASLLRTVYAPVFEVMDPTKATAEEISDAFRHFNPPGQRGRMVTLFMGLMAYADMIPEIPKQRPGPRPNGARKRQPKSATTSSLPMADAPQLASTPAVTGDTYTVTLESGGTVSVLVNVNLFKLSIHDRQFVIDLVDKLTGYHQDHISASQEADAS